MENCSNLALYLVNNLFDPAKFNRYLGFINFLLNRGYSILEASYPQITYYIPNEDKVVAYAIDGDAIDGTTGEVLTDDYGMGLGL